MAVDDYDVEFGYSLNELTDNYSKKAYVLSGYELHSLEEIERCLAERKYIDRSECVEHERYLENMQKRLSMILLAEERAGIMNWELREFLKRARNLAAQMGAVAKQLPEIADYRENALKHWKGHAHHVAVSTRPEPFMS